MIKACEVIKHARSVELRMMDHIVKEVKRLLSRPEVQQCYYVSDGVSFVLILVATNLSEYEEILQKLFADNKDIKSYKTLIVFGHFDACIVMIR